MDGALSDRAVVIQRKRLRDVKVSVALECQQEVDIEREVEMVRDRHTASDLVVAPRRDVGPSTPSVDDWKPFGLCLEFSHRTGCSVSGGKSHIDMERQLPHFEMIDRALVRISFGHDA